MARPEVWRQRGIDTGYELSYPLVVDAHPDGPRVIGQRNQVTLPSDQIKSIGVGPGDSVWITINPDRPGSLVILNEESMNEIFRKGWVAI